MKVDLNKIKLTFLTDSVRREKMSDERYFSEEFSNYISNSRLKLINPDQEGSPELYEKGLQGESTTSLNIGSSVHELVLQPENFELGPDLNKPTAKLGMVIDAIYEFRQSGLTILDSIIAACKKVHYYENRLDYNRITAIITTGLEYYMKMKQFDLSRIILLSAKDRKTVKTCVRNLIENYFIHKVLYPTDLFDDPMPYFNEDAFFIDIKGEYEDKNCILQVKMKADNWTVDEENKILTLNDLKTTSHFIGYFMETSFVNYHYSRQFALYLTILVEYAKQKYNLDDNWQVRCNVIVVETTGENRAQIFSINDSILESGKREFEKLLKMVAFCEINGYKNEYDFYDNDRN